jgi:outer membrane protein
VGNVKAFILVLLTGLFALTSVHVVAEDKVAVIDVNTAIFASAAAQARIKESVESADFVALKAKLDGASADFQALAKEAESKRLTWSQDEAAAHQKKMEYVKADAELASRKIQAEQQQLQQRVQQEFMPQLQVAIQEVVAEEGITVLIRQEAVIMAAPASNLTGKVIDRLNNPSKPE